VPAGFFAVRGCHVLATTSDALADALGRHLAGYASGRTQLTRTVGVVGSVFTSELSGYACGTLLLGVNLIGHQVLLLSGNDDIV
jgi:hypothetical protein